MRRCSWLLLGLLCMCLLWVGPVGATEQISRSDLTKDLSDMRWWHNAEPYFLVPDQEVGRSRLVSYDEYVKHHGIDPRMMPKARIVELVRAGKWDRIHPSFQASIEGFTITPDKRKIAVVAFVLVAAALTMWAVITGRRRAVGTAYIYGLLTAWAVVMAYPLVWMILTSLKKDADLYLNPFALPTVFRWENYTSAWNDGHLGPCVVNSIEVTGLSMILALGMASACAFAFARLRFGVLQTFLWTYVMFGFLVPDSVRFFPLMIFFAKLNLYDSKWALIMIYSAGGIPWNTFFLRAFMEHIPADYEDAAVVDGASVWQVFRHVTLPLIRAPLVTLATFHVMGTWNEFLMAFFLTSSEAARTLPVGVRMLQGALTTNQTAIAAGLVIVMLPMLLFFVLLQRHVVKGLSAGALVG